MCSAANEDLSIVHSAFQVSAGIAKYGIHLGQHQFNRFFAQNGSIRELAKELVQANTVKQMMVVTDSHPMPSGHGEVKEASSLKKGRDLSGSGGGCFHLVSTLGSHFGNSGPPWETMGAARWT